MTAVEDLLGSGGLWVGALTALAVALGLGCWGRPRADLALLAGIVVGTTTSGVGSLLAGALLLAVGLGWPPRETAPRSVLASAAAAGATYLCVPDTERAVVVLGAVLAAGAASAVARWTWVAGSRVVGASLVWVALTDGAPRASAVMGTLVIVTIHAILQHPAGAGSRTPVALGAMGIGVAAMLVASRVAGVGDGSARAAAIGAGCVGATVIARLVVDGSIRR